MTSRATAAMTWAPPNGRDVYVCGIGARTAIGTTAAASAAAVRGSISGLSLHPVFVDQEYEPVSFAADALLDPDVPIAERMLSMLRSVAAEALRPTGSDETVSIDRCWLALPEPRRGMPPHIDSHLAAAVSEELALRDGLVHTLRRGHAGGLIALQAAAQTMSRGEAEAVLVIGVDSYHDPGTIASLDIRRRLMSARNRSGFPPGEGAGACLLASGEAVRRHRLSAVTRIRSAATAVEPHPLRSNEPCLGDGLTAALAAVIQGLNLPQELITATYCSLNGERYRNEEFLYALMRTQEGFVDAHDYVSPADCWGDVGAASGPLFAVLAVTAHLRGYSKGRFPLLWAGSDSGYRSACALAQS
jgi:3-oxoacyl-[acyl-carrier-protein] synthase-1